jgi:acetyl esterase/lipase
MKAFLLATASAVSLFCNQSMAQSPSTPTAPPPKFAAPTAPTPKVAPDMQAVLSALQSLGGKPVETLTPAEARKQPTPAQAVQAIMKQQAVKPDISVTTQEMTYGNDPLQKVRLYIPEAKPQGGALLPLVVYFHGGGWVIADLDTYDAAPRMLAKELNAIVVSVEYRTAPEAKFPSQHMDAARAYEFVLKNLKMWGADPARVVLAGESAGGNLAVATAIYARDNKLSLPVHILSVYPIANSDKTLPSKATNANAKPLNTPMLGWFTYYFSKSEADALDPRINLVKANLTGLPPTTIINAEFDPLTSDGETLADAMRKAGVPVEQRTFQGVTHEFFGMGQVVKGAKDAQVFALERLKSMRSTQ